jgi:integrase
MAKAKISVTLRSKASIRGDRKLLYLDYWPPIDGTDKSGNPIKTRREWLHLFTFNRPRTPIDTLHNDKANEEATMLWMRRTNELNKPEIYNEFELEQLRKKEIGEGSFTNYLKDFVIKKKYRTFDSWTCFEKHLLIFAKNKELKFSDITERFCTNFKEYLLTAKNIKTKQPMMRNTSHLYYNFFKIVLNIAYKDGHLLTYLGNKVGTISKAEVRRNYLTLDELNSLVNKPCTDQVIKRAALFSALTGLRFSDIEKLTWDEIDGTVLNFTQRKTGGVETMPISDQAITLMGDRSQAKPFEGLKYGFNRNIYLGRWIKSAGITKKITFHCFRHSYAVLQLSAGTSIFTVSKMLGHRDLKTTQIYSRVVNQAKVDAAQRITLNF